MTTPDPAQEEAERIMLECKDRLGILPLRWEALPPEIYQSMVAFLADSLHTAEARGRREAWTEAADYLVNAPTHKEFVNLGIAEFHRRAQPPLPVSGTGNGP